MKLNKWTRVLASAGVVSVAAVTNAEEQVMSQVLTQVSSTTLGGYVDTAAVWLPGAGGEAPIPGRFNDGEGKVDRFNLNVISLELDRVPGDDNWAAGYSVQLLYGPDAIGYNPSLGAYDDTDGASNPDFAIKRAYVDLVFPVGTGLDMKMGVFDTIIGYESFDSYSNPNWGRSYGWQLEPTQHTGILFDYAFSDVVSAAAGIANIWGPGINVPAYRPPNPGGNQNPAYYDSKATYMGAVTLTAPDSLGALAGSSLTGGVMNGPSGNRKDTTSWYVGGSMNTGVEGLAVGLAFDYLEDGPFVLTADGNNWAWAVAGYATYQFTEKALGALRVDYTKASSGVWYTDNETDAGANQLFGLTATIDYSLWANVVFRGEFRWDNNPVNDSPFLEGGEDNDGKNNIFTLAANVIYRF